MVIQAGFGDFSANFFMHTYHPKMYYRNAYLYTRDIRVRRVSAAIFNEQKSEELQEYLSIGGHSIDMKQSQYKMLYSCLKE